MEALPGSRAGALLFTRAGTLMSLPFDMKRLSTAGEAVPIARNVASVGPIGLAAASRQAVLAYVSGARPAVSTCGAIARAGIPGRRRPRQRCRVHFAGWQAPGGGPRFGTRVLDS